MESDSPEKIGWTYVKNSVASRMLDDSMAHRLASTRKMQRRTKLFNAMLRKLGPTTRYSQYVKIKRMVLTNVPQDYETEDDDVVLTVDDYNSLYNSGELKNYTTTNFDESVNLYCKQIRKSIHRNKTKTARVSVSVNGSSSERVIKKRSQSKKSLSRNVGEEKSRNKVEDEPQSVLGKECNSPLVKFHKDARTLRTQEQKNEDFEKEKSAEKTDVILNNESQREESADKRSEDATPQLSAEVEGESDGEVDGEVDGEGDGEGDGDRASYRNSGELNNEIKEEETSVTKTPKLDVNRADEKVSIDRQDFYNKARRNLTSELENVNDTDHIKKEDNTNQEKDPETDSITECNPMGQSTPLYQDTMYQLKDSGIDEDSQEEFFVDTKYNTESIEINRENKINLYLKILTPLTIEEGVDETESNINFNDILVLKEEDKTITEENREEKSHKQDLPKVTCTEVVSKKYKIVREGQFEDINNTITKECNSIILPDNTSRISNANQISNKVENDVINDDEELQLESQLEENICSDEDIGSHNDGYKSYYNDYDYGEDADDEENTPISPATTKRLQQLKRLNLTSEDVSSSSDEDTEFYFAKIPDVRLGQINDVRYKKTLEKHKKNRNDSNKENSCRNTQEMITDQNNELNETHRQEDQEISREEIPSRTSIVSKRPQNLQEFIDEEKLIDNRTAATFILKDVEDDDDIYMLNIPSTMLSPSNLKGKKMVLKETKVRFGKDRYRISYRGEDSLSCVMGTGRQRKPYKTVKIKLTGVITVREKLPRLIATTNCNDSACDGSSFGLNQRQSPTKKREIGEIDKDNQDSPRKKRIRSS